MSINKINILIEKYKLDHILSIVIILIILFLIYRVFTNVSYSLESQIQYNNNNNNNNNKNYSYNNNTIIEGFAAPIGMEYLGSTIYGNILPLMNQSQIPKYEANTCSFILDTVYRIDSLIIIFNSNNNTDTSSTAIRQYNNNDPIYIQFQDVNGNMRNLKSAELNNGSPPNFKSIITQIPNSPRYPNSNSKLYISSITDENGLAVYTSKITITIGNTSNNIQMYNSSDGNGYIFQYGIYGGQRDLITKTDYSRLANTLSTFNIPKVPNNPTSYDNINNTDSYVFAKGDDTYIYALQLGINQKLINTISIPPNSFFTTTQPFNIKITYNNSLYPGTQFIIDDAFYIRSDTNKIPSQNNYIYLTQPIIANQLIFTINRVIIIVNMLNTQTTSQLEITSTQLIGKTPLPEDISSYKQTINTTQNNSNNDVSTTNICPSINELSEKQKKTQEICDTVEYQDKIKSEKLRLARNKQYLLKLQDQQLQIDQLNMVIQDLETKREQRAAASDQVRVLQYQQQKTDASRVRDLANQRIDSQKNNQLYMDVKVNTF